MRQNIICLLLLLTLSAEASDFAEVLNSTKIDGYLRATYHNHNIKNDKIYKLTLR